MIYVSSSCVRAKRISEAVGTLAEAGFRCIELSGGTDYYPALETDLLNLKKKYDLNYLCHNYFPPPREPLVVNLASPDDSIRAKSIEHLRENIRLSRLLGADRISFHAGFFIQVDVAKIGQELRTTVLAERQAALDRFCQSYTQVAHLADGLPAYVENNVYSRSNHNNYGSKLPLMLLHYQDFLELREKIDFPFLLDLGHLKVSCNTLGLDFHDQLTKLFPHAGYLHLSDNDGHEDLHAAVTGDSIIYQALCQLDLADKVISLEVVNDLSGLKQTYDLIAALVKSHKPATAQSLSKG